MILTIDIENLDLTEQGIRRLLRLLDKYNAKATFFVVTDQIKKHGRFIKQIAEKHEIASHTQNHKNLKLLGSKAILYELRKSKENLENLGINCTGFRAPYNLPNKDILTNLNKYGYEYDSSLCRVYFPSRFNYRGIPNSPYMAKGDDLTKKGDFMMEFPISSFSVFKFPCTMSFIKIFHWWIPKRLLSSDKKERTLSMHDHDLHAGSYQEGQNRFLEYLQRFNSGEKVFKILEDMMKREHRIISCKDYLYQLKAQARNN